MMIDVTLQTCGVDYRELATTVHLPPEVLEVRYNPRDSMRAREVAGPRRKLARVLRDAGYLVVWDDPNPAVALASRTSPARAAANRANGRLSKGRPRAEVRLCPEPLKTQLARLDKGELADVVYVATGSAAAGWKAVTKALAAREEVST